MDQGPQQLVLLVLQPVRPEEDDPPHPRLDAGVPVHRREDLPALQELRIGAEETDRVVRDVDPFGRPLQDLPVQRVPFHDLGDEIREIAQGPAVRREDPEADVRAGEELDHQPPAEVAQRAGQQDLDLSVFGHFQPTILPSRTRMSPGRRCPIWGIIWGTVNPTRAPLADRMRPAALSDFVGQEELLGEGRFLSSVLSARPLPSLIFWGPPGSGKTTLARILAAETDAVFLPYSAVLSGIKEIREALAELKRSRAGGGPAAARPAILFIDEIHRWNKAQQDALLPFVEDGTITLFGTTTENPSFEIRNALLSRCRVLVLSPLLPAHLERIVARALTDPERGLGKPETFLAPDALQHVVAVADGDARVALNALEAAVAIAVHKRLAAIDMETAEEALRKKGLLYDKDGEEHYKLISALHKSLRGSDPDAALYWLARMLAAGEDPLYVARRMIRFASEDVGN